MSSSRELSDTLPCLLDPQDCQEKHQHLNCRRCGVAKKKLTHQLNLAQLVPQPDKIDPKSRTGEGANPEEAESLIQFDTLVLHDLSRLSRRTPLAFQGKKICSWFAKGSKRRLDRIVKNPVLVYEHNSINLRISKPRKFEALCKRIYVQPPHTPCTP